MDIVLVIDFGGQYTHLIARRIRELGVYSEILPYDIDLKQVSKLNPNGIILSGGPNSVYDKGTPQLTQDFYAYIKENKIPVLGICYGFHLHRISAPNQEQHDIQLD